MIRVRVEFKYHGEINEFLDAHIQEIAAKAGMEWYAQGYDLFLDERDIYFDLDYNPNGE